MNSLLETQIDLETKFFEEINQILPKLNYIKFKGERFNKAFEYKNIYSIELMGPMQRDTWSLKLTLKNREYFYEFESSPNLEPHTYKHYDVELFPDANLSYNFSYIVKNLQLKNKIKIFKDFIRFL